MRGENVPKSIEVPISIVIRPKYIGFLVYLNGPFVTIRVARYLGEDLCLIFERTCHFQEKDKIQEQLL